MGEKGGTFLPVEGYFCQISFFVTLLLRCNSQIFIFRRRDIPFFDNVLQAKITQLIILSLHFLGNLKICLQIDAKVKQSFSISIPVTLKLEKWNLNAIYNLE